MSINLSDSHDRLATALWRIIGVWPRRNTEWHVLEKRTVTSRVFRVFELRSLVGIPPTLIVKQPALLAWIPDSCIIIMSQVLLCLKPSRPLISHAVLRLFTSCGRNLNMLLSGGPIVCKHFDGFNMPWTASRCFRRLTCINCTRKGLSRSRFIVHEHLNEQQPTPSCRHVYCCACIGCGRLYTLRISLDSANSTHGHHAGASTLV